MCDTLLCFNGIKPYQMCTKTKLQAFEAYKYNMGLTVHSIVPLIRPLTIKISLLLKVVILVLR